MNIFFCRLTNRRPGIGIILIIVLLSAMTSACGQSGIPETLAPRYLDTEKEVVRQKIALKKEARRIFKSNHLLDSALREFEPEAIAAGIYNFKGITIYLGIARFANCDNAYGIYSALTARPRERWNYAGGEISYRAPYVSGFIRNCAFWIYSPTNPSTYAAFFHTHAEKIIDEYSKGPLPARCSYHWKILPRENRYTNSVFYIRERMIDGLPFSNTYTAVYQAKKHEARIYIEKAMDEKQAKTWMRDYLKAISMKKPVKKVSLSASPGETWYWQGTQGIHLLHRYRWLIFYFQDIPDIGFARNMLRASYRAMQRIRKEVMN